MSDATCGQATGRENREEASGRARRPSPVWLPTGPLPGTARRASRAIVTFLASVVLGAALAAGCTDDDDKPIAPGTGEDLETPTSQLTPPSPPDQ
ncbi:MAG: hypothetical protein M3P85_09785 [Actinomycetota bacterium]|nr:hypothetical protein [Actinomycetota bacterium]